MFGISRWRQGHLLAAWSVYWAALAAITLGGAIRGVLRVTLPASGHGSFSASFGDTGVVLKVLEAGATVWTGTAPFSTIALWVAGPPLLLWGVWMFSRPRQPDATAASLDRSGGTSASLAPGDPSFDRAAREDVVRERHERP